MPVFEITAPDGKTYEIEAPEGATPEQVLSYVQENMQSTPKDDSKLNGLMLGALKPIDNAARALAGALPEGVTSAIDTAGAAMGMPSQEQAYEANQAAREGNSATGMQLAGNIAGTLPTLALPGGALAQGAAGGALRSPARYAAQSFTSPTPSHCMWSTPSRRFEQLGLRRFNAHTRRWRSAR